MLNSAIVRQILCNEQDIYAIRQLGFQSLDVIREIFSSFDDVSAPNSCANTALMLAAKTCFCGSELLRENTIETMKLLLSHGADVNASGENGRTPLMLAVLGWSCEINDHWHEIEWKEQLRGIGEWKQQELTAVNTDDPSAVKFLLDMGADINARDEDGNTALHFAARIPYRDLQTPSKSRPVVELLIERGADLNAVNFRGIAPLGNAVIYDYFTSRILVRHGADVHRAEIIARAAAFGTAGTVRMLLAHGADVNLRYIDGQTALIFSCAGREYIDVDKIRILIKAGADLNAQDDFGKTALIYATISEAANIFRREFEILSELLKNGADANIRDNDGKTALIHAAERGNTQNITQLLENGADANIRDNDGKTAIMYTFICHGCRVSDIAELISHGADVNLQDKDGNTVLIQIADMPDLFDGSPDFLAKKVMHRKFERIMSYLRRRHKAVQLILAAGADVNIRNSEGITALAAAQRHNTPEIADLLMKYGAEA